MKQSCVSRWLAGCGLLAMLAAACGDQDQASAPDISGNTDEAGVTVLAKADGWRDSLGDVGGAVFEVAPDETSAEQLWKENVPDDAEPADDPGQVGRHGDLEDGDFDAQLVAVWSFGESGACPEWVDTVTSSAEGVTVETARTEERPCTDDFHPYRMVLAIDRDMLPAADTLPAPLVDGPAGDVVTYPAYE